MQQRFLGCLTFFHSQTVKGIIEYVLLDKELAFVVMAANPAEIVDGLFRGLVLAFYDFVRLTWAGLILPFVARTQRFWPAVIATDKRLSSLSFLAIWILAVFAMANGNARQLASSALSEKRSDSITVLLLCALLTTTVIDLAIRAGFCGIRDRARRAFYEPIARIAVANIVVGVFLIIVAGALWPPDNQLKQYVPVEYLACCTIITEFPIFYPSLFLLPFAVALAIVIDKAFQIQDRRKRIALGTIVVFLAPAAIVNVGLQVDLWTGIGWAIVMSDDAPAPPSPSLHQQFTRCVFQNDQVSVSGLLRLSHSQSIAVDPHNLAVTYEARYLGRGIPGQTPIVIPGSNFASYNFVAKFDPEGDANTLPPREFDCDLWLLKKYLSDDSSLVFTRTVPHARPDAPH
jgi:hypothetical protein